jgi:hypothetical protein
MAVVPSHFARILAALTAAIQHALVCWLFLTNPFLARFGEIQFTRVADPSPRLVLPNCNRNRDGIQLLLQVMKIVTLYSLISQTAGTGEQDLWKFQCRLADFEDVIDSGADHQFSV